MPTSTSPDIVSSRIARRLAQTVGLHRYQMWFDRSARLDYRDQQHRLEVVVPNRFIADWIGRHFQQALQDAARDEVGCEVDLTVNVDPVPFEGLAVRNGNPQAGAGQSNSATNTSRSTADTVAMSNHAPGLVGEANTTTPATMPQHRQGAPVHHRRAQASSLSLRYKLEDFVVGPSNQLAYAAALRVVDAEDDALAGVSPLFIHGGVGLGKTHLLQGICKRMLDRQPNARILYTTGEQFTNEFLTAVRSGKIDGFRQRIRKLDLLAVDDVHFIANKTATQQEFLHSFNAIELAGARVVLASDQHPKLIAQFSEALVNRCVRGMVVQVQPPDTATRMKIVQTLAQRRGISMLESVVAVVAAKCPGSVRELEGTLTRLHALATLTQENKPGFVSDSISTQPAIGHAIINRAFAQDLQSDRAKPVRVDAILHHVAERLGIDKQRILRGERHRLTVLARAMVIHLARQLTPLSYPEIAQALKSASHSSVIAAEQRVVKQIEEHHPVVFTNPQTGLPENLPVGEVVEQVRHVLRKAG